MRGFIYVALGDISQFNADAITYSTSHRMRDFGELASAFNANVSGFTARYKETKAAFRAGRPVVDLGDAFWVPLPGSSKPVGVVSVVATGGYREDDAHFAARTAVTAAIDTAVANLRQQFPEKRLLIALPAFRMGKGGDKFQALPSSLAQIEAARAALDRHPNVDVVFVLYTSALYEVFLEARRRADPPYREERADLPPGLLEAVQGGRCVLFIGAGLSQGAGLTGYSTLLQKLAERLALKPDGTPKDDLFYGLDVAQWYLEEDPEALVPLIRELYGPPPVTPASPDAAADRCFPVANAAEPSLAHYLLMSLPVRHVITTNYDDLLERALMALRRYPVKVVGQEDIARTGGQDGVYVVKFHGDAATALTSGDIVLSRDQYDGFFARFPAMAALLEGLLLNQTFFFVGYSLRDPNFRQIYYRIHALLRESARPAFATTLDPIHAYSLRQWKNKNVHVLPMEGDAFALREQRLLRLLDRLAEEATGRTRLFLEPTVIDAAAAATRTPADRIPELRHALQTAGEAVIRAARRKLSSDEALATARTLAFLTEQGWRPPRAGKNGRDAVEEDEEEPVRPVARTSTGSISLAMLWENLADRADSPEAARGMLIAGLAHAGSFKRVCRIRQKIAAIDNAIPPTADLSQGAF